MTFGTQHTLAILPSRSKCSVPVQVARHGAVLCAMLLVPLLFTVGPASAQRLTVIATEQVDRTMDESEANLSVTHPEVGSLLSIAPSYLFGQRLEKRLFKQWGLKTSLYYSESDQWHDPDELDGLTIDLQRSVLRSSGGSELALGLGWQRSDDDLEHTGLRLTVAGRWQLGAGLKLYGQTAWLPAPGSEVNEWLDPTDPQEIEAGLSYDVIPSISLRAGFRWHQSDMQSSDALFDRRRFMLGAGVRW